MPFLLAEILNFQGSTHQYGVGSFSSLKIINNLYTRYMDLKKELYVNDSY